MGGKILGWFGGILVFLIVLGIAMTPLEEQLDDVKNAAPVLSGVPAPVISPETDDEPEPTAGNAAVTPTSVPSDVPAPVPTPTPAVSLTPEPTAPTTVEDADYVLNINSSKFHYPSCPSVDLMNESNKRFFAGTRDEVLEQGFDPCQNCNP